MKTPLKRFLLPALIAALSLLLASRAAAQTFTTLHSFSWYPSDGANPQAGLVLSGNTLFGTTFNGGNSISLSGTLFAININGTRYTNFYNFTGGRDGGNPAGGLIVSGNTLYGTASAGGTNGNGTVFAIHTNGANFTNLHTFTATSSTPLGYLTNSDGANPEAGLLLSGNMLYGAAYDGGASGLGTLFAINTNSMVFAHVYTFVGGLMNGLYPDAALISSGNTLYGTLQEGGNPGFGTVFAVNTDGTGFTNLYNFKSLDDGTSPATGLVLSGGTLYGTALGGMSGGVYKAGTVFAINTDGSGFTNLYYFGARSGPSLTNSDGATPSTLILSGNTLYGTTEYGGRWGNGTVFAVNTDGMSFTVLHTFTPVVANKLSYLTNSDGANPAAGLILSGNTLYGTTKYGGTNSWGTVFSLSLGSASAPPMTITLSGTNAILTWSANAVGYTLEFATNLVSPVAWDANLPAPAIINGNNTVTNPISSTQKFYRLANP